MSSKVFVQVVKFVRKLKRREVTSTLQKFKKEICLG